MGSTSSSSLLPLTWGSDKIRQPLLFVSGMVSKGHLINITKPIFLSLSHLRNSSCFSSCASNQEKYQIHLSYYKSQHSGHRTAPFLSADQIIIILVLSKVSRGLNSLPTEGKALGYRKRVYFEQNYKECRLPRVNPFGELPWISKLQEVYMHHANQHDDT